MLLDHLKSRGFDDSVCHAWIDESSNTAAFPLFTFDGTFTGFQEYKPHGQKSFRASNYRAGAKYFTHVTSGAIRFWLPKNFWDLAKGKNYIFVQEGIFSAMPLARLGYPVVATLTSNNKELIQNLRIQGFHLVSLLDGDPAGREYISGFSKALFLLNGLDVGDLWESNPGELKELVDNFAVSFSESA